MADSGSKMRGSIQSEESSPEKVGKVECTVDVSTTSWRKLPGWKRQVVYTAVFYFGYFVFGWVIGQKGAAFMDLLLVTDTDVATGSILFTMAGLASMAGGLAGGFLLDFTGRPLIMMTCVFLLNAVVNSTLALCKSLALMSTLYFISHFALSVCDVASNPLLARIWPGTDSGGVLQGLHFTFSVGAVLSPLATEPFLAPRSEETYLIPIRELEMELAAEGNTDQVHDGPASSNYWYNSSILYNVTELPGKYISTGTVKETQVLYALLISAGLSLICAILMMMLMLVPVKYHKNTEETEGQGEMPSQMKKLYYTALVMLGVYNFFSSSVEDVFPHYLMTFVVRELDWSKSSGAGLTSVYWVGLAIGRLSGVALVRWMSPTKLIIGCMTFMMCSLLAVLLAAIFHASWAVWVSAFLVGLSTSILFPTGLLYAHQNVAQLTGKVSSIIFTTPMIAAMINPMVLATLMTRYSNLWYIYVFMVQITLAMISFLVLHRLSLQLFICRQSAQQMQLEMSEKLDKNLETCQPFLNKSSQSV